MHSGDTELGTSYYLLSGQCSLTPQDSFVHSQIDDSDIGDELPASTVRTLLVTYALLDIIRLREIQKKEIPQASQLGLEIHISTSNDIKAFVEDLGFTIDERTGHWPDILKNFNPRFKLCISDTHLLQNKCSQHLASLVKEQLQPQQEPRRSSRLKLLKDAQKKNT